MYYLKIKCGIDPYQLDDYLEFYFVNYDELMKFAKTIFEVSNYEIIIGQCGDEDEQD